MGKFFVMNLVLSTIQHDRRDIIIQICKQNHFLTQSIISGLENEVALDETGTRIADFELLHMSNADTQTFKVLSLCILNTTEKHVVRNG